MFKLARFQTITKIRKLIALATSDNEHEAKEARDKAAAMMVEHGITIEEVEANAKAAGEKRKPGYRKMKVGDVPETPSSDSTSNGSTANPNDDPAARSAGGYQEIIMVYERTRYCKDGFVIGYCSDGTVVKGPADEGDLVRGLPFRFYGRWEEHPKYGRQFAFKVFCVDQPHSREGIVNYLLKFVEGCGIGHAKAHALWEAYGPDAIRVLRTQPKQAAKAVGLKIEQAEKAAEQLRDQLSNQDTRIDLLGLFDGIGFSRDMIENCIRRWRSLAAAKVRRDPFCLLTAHMPSAGFARCDTLYQKLGHDPSKLKRQTLCAWHHMASSMEGHTWHKAEDAVRAIEQKVDSVNVQPIKALKLGRRAGWLAVRRTEENGERATWIADARRARNEETIARKIKALSSVPAEWPEIVHKDLTDHQRSELAKALVSPVAILVGSAGTGKTFSAAAIISQIVEKHGLGSIAICTPTGKAAVRCSQAMKKYSIPIRATTIHRLLRPLSNGHGTGDWGFAYNETSPMPYKFVIVDEVSMVDADLMASVLRACAVGTQILFIGDPFQLPPVGHGAPLRDMLAAGLPSGCLTEIKRNAGLIVENATAVKDGRPIKTCDRFDDNGNNFRLIPVTSPANVIAAIKAIYEAVMAKGERDPFDDLQIVVPINEKSPLSRKPINDFLQGLVNQHGRQVEGNRYRIGDKIICTSPGMYPALLPDYDHGYWEKEDSKDEIVANGEQGRVIALAERFTLVRFPDIGEGIRTIRINMKTESSKSFDLAYAITIHKSQGSEAPIVIIINDEARGADFVFSREAIYTAITRAADRCILIGSRATLERRAKRVSLSHRKTFLKELLCLSDEAAVVVAASAASTEGNDHGSSRQHQPSNDIESEFGIASETEPAQVAGR